MLESLALQQSCLYSLVVTCKKTQIEKKANSALLHPRTDFRSMMGKERLHILSLVFIHRDIFLYYDKISKEDSFN